MARTQEKTEEERGEEFKRKWGVYQRTSKLEPQRLRFFVFQLLPLYLFISFLYYILLLHI